MFSFVSFLLSDVDVFWCMLLYTSWCMLMYVDICWYMLMYVDVCWCMLIYVARFSFPLLKVKILYLPFFPLKLAHLLSVVRWGGLWTSFKCAKRVCSALWTRGFQGKIWSAVFAMWFLCSILGQYYSISWQLMKVLHLTTIWPFYRSGTVFS